MKIRPDLSGVNIIGRGMALGPNKLKLKGGEPNMISNGYPEIRMSPGKDCRAENPTASDHDIETSTHISAIYYSDRVGESEPKEQEQSENLSTLGRLRKTWGMIPMIARMTLKEVHPRTSPSKQTRPKKPPDTIASSCLCSVDITWW